MLFLLMLEVILEIGTADLDLKLIYITALGPDELITLPLEYIKAIDIVFPGGKEMVKPLLNRLLGQRFTFRLCYVSSYSHIYCLKSILSIAEIILSISSTEDR